MDSVSSSSSARFTVFISHAGEDKATIAIPLRERLREKGISAFVDEADMLAGTDSKWAMKRAMETAKIGVIVLSPEFVVKEWPMKELMCFLQRREEYLCEGNEGVTIPTIVPFFYRLKVGELYEEPNLDRRDGDGVLLHEKWRFKERAERGDVEANINEIKTALRKLHGIMGVRNTVEANNDSSYDMSEKREWVLYKLCNEICKVASEMKKKKMSREKGQERENDLHHAGKVNVASGEKTDGSGEGGEGRNGVKAEKQYHDAIDGGDVDAMYNLAVMLHTGAEGVKRDAVEAEKLYRRAIDGGHIGAMFNLAKLLKKGAEGVKRDAAEAEKLYRRAIDGGHVDAMYNLAVMLANGAEGVERDAVEAEKLYRRAIDGGEVDALNNLANLLRNGAEGVKRDAVEAEKLYRRAIDGGHVDAMWNLANLLKKGAEGVKRDIAEAERLRKLYHRTKDGQGRG